MILRRGSLHEEPLKRKYTIKGHGKREMVNRETTIGTQQWLSLQPKWHPFPNIVHYLSQIPMGPGGKVVHVKGNMVQFRTNQSGVKD